jgi:acyl-CoA reductase-like NAD-dependent aldehyde dehydrogenase
MANEKLGRICMNEQVAGLETAPRNYRQYIAGTSIDAESGRTFEDLDPFNGEVCGACQAAGKSDAENAIGAAAGAFPASAATPPVARQRLFRRAADIVERRSSPRHPYNWP